MTETQAAEWRHVYLTRIAILCPVGSEPTTEQDRIARREADEAIENLSE